MHPWKENRLEKEQWKESIYPFKDVRMPHASACAGKQTTQYLGLQLLRRRSAVKFFRDGHGTKIYYAYAFRELENDENNENGSI